MPSCNVCKNWLTQRVTDYEDGSRIVNHKSAENKGLCEILKIETDWHFGCNQFVEGHEHVEIMGRKTGSPWHHSKWGPCPECHGVQDGNGQWTSHVAGGGMCRRCAATGRVLYYDDGYIGEEQTRRHPNEIKGQEVPPPNLCLSCQRDVDPNWVACPHCGTRTNKPDEPVRVMEIL